MESIKYTVVAFCRLESQEYFLLFYAFISASFCTSNVRQWNFQPEMEVIWLSKLSEFLQTIKSLRVSYVGFFVVPSKQMASTRLISYSVHFSFFWKSYFMNHYDCGYYSFWSSLISSPTAKEFLFQQARKIPLTGTMAPFQHSSARSICEFHHI